MPDGDVIDSLSLEIGASVNKSIDAIDQLQSKLAKLNGALGNYLNDGKYLGAIHNLTSGFAELDNSISDNVVSKVASLAKSLNTLSSSADKVGKSFSTVTKYPETLNEHVSKNLGGFFAQFGIKGEENIKRVTNGFIELENLSRSGSFTGNAMDGLIRDIQELSNIAVEGTKVYEGLVDAVNEYVRTAERIHIERGSGIEYRDGDLLGYLGAIAGSNSKKFTTKPGGVDFQEFAREINDQFHLIPEHFNEEGNSWFRIDEFADVMRRARAEMNGFADDSQKIKPAADEVFVAISKQTEAVRQAMSSFQGTGAETTLSPFERILPELKNLSGVTIPDFSQLESLATSIGKFGNKSQSAGVENLPKAVTGLRELSDVTIPDLTGLADFTTSIGKLGNKGPTTASENIPKMAEGLRSLSDVTIPDFSGLNGLAQFMSSLGNKSPQRAVEILPALIEFLTGLSFVQIPELTGIQNVSVAIKELGSANATKAAANLPSLTKALSDLMVMLGSLPDVSDKTIQLVTALGQLNANAVKGAVGAAKLASANQTLTSSYGALGTLTDEAALALKNMANWVMKCFTSVNTFKSGMNAVASGMKQIASAAINAGKGFVDLKGTLGGIKSAVGNLGVAFIKLRGIVWGFKRIASIFSIFTESASSLVEVQNVVRHVYDPTYIEEFNEASENTIETLGMSKLAFQQYASRYQAMGKALGITNSQMGEAEDHLKAMGVEYGTTSGKMGDMSVNLTRLAGDMASFYDVDVSSVQQSLQAVYTGQTRPLMLAA